MNSNNLTSSEIPLPTLAVQQQIVSKIERIFAEKPFHFICAWKLQNFHVVLHCSI
ncbi:MAG: hypothetical protein LBG15_06130 [Dysgonamonadaceae bacterium]|nr:hypothetical protein [Dysgonamonadaceae bacterium]